MDLLVVEDDDYVGRAMLRMARLAGLEAKHVNTLEEAQEALASDSSIAAVLTDLHLERQSGLALVEALRAKGDMRPVIVMSGLASERTPEAWRALGVAVYLHKPFDTEDLSRAFRRAVHGA